MTLHVYCIDDYPEADISKNSPFTESFPKCRHWQHAHSCLKSRHTFCGGTVVASAVRLSFLKVLLLRWPPLLPKINHSLSSCCLAHWYMPAATTPPEDLIPYVTVPASSSCFLGWPSFIWDTQELLKCHVVNHPVDTLGSRCLVSLLQDLVIIHLLLLCAIKL